MNRRNFLELSGYSTILPFVNPKNIFNALWSAHEMITLRNNVGIFLERGGTIGWLLAGGTQVVVDSQFPEQAGHLIEEIKKKSNIQLDALINTHHHGDHTGGNIAFKGLADRVVAHTNAVINQKNSAQSRGTEDQQLYADKTFDQTWGGSFGPEIISCRYFGPAHTNGDIVVHFENSNVAHVGDLVFNRRFPYIDKGAGANIQSWIGVLSQIEETFDKDTLFIFGHAADGYEVTGSKADIQAFKNYLQRLMEYMKKQVADGKSKEEIIESTTGIPGADQWTGSGVQRSIESAWEELHATEE